MQRKQVLYTVAILALLVSMLPMAAVAQEAPPEAQTSPLNIEVLALTDEADDASQYGKASQPGSLLDGMLAPDGMDFFNEVESNNTPATANALASNDLAVLGNIFPAADLDYFSFTGNTGDRVYAATMTSFSASASVDSYLTLFGSDGTTVIEDDNDNGSFGSTSSSIAGATLPANGTYYLQVKHNSATGQLRPYRLHLKVQSGSPTPETEPNSVSPGQPLPPSGWVSGALTATTDIDIFAVTLNAGDTIYMSLDLDPERDTIEWNAQLGLAVFNNFILVVNDAGTTGPDSEAFFMTVKDAGTYYVYVLTPTGGTTFDTYNLSVSILPKAQQANCTTYTSTDVPVVLPTGPGMAQSTLTVPGNPRIADIDVSIVLTHTFMQDLDVHLVSPAGNDNGLFTDVGNSTVGSANIQMNTTLDDEAALPIGQFSVVAGPSFTPELNYRLSWYDYTDAGGVWTLKLYDDATGDGGELQSWSVTICEPPPPPSCPVGYEPVTVYSSDFEADDGGFTHSGAQDEWERGLPTFTPLTTCNSGVNCWVTDLDQTYNASSDQTLLSPAINLAGYSGPVIMRWAQRYHMESASFDGASVQVQELGSANPTQLWTWLDATMNSTVGSPSTTIAQSAGWGERWADISSYAGLSVEALFNLSSDTTVQLAGLAIDDVSVTACQEVPSNPAISLDKTVGTDPGVCATTDEITLPYGGGDVTYCYEVTNTGDVSFNTHDLDDSELGALLNGLPYMLSPGASAFLTATSYINFTTVNTGTWTAYNTFDGGPVQAIASDVATVTVDAPAPAIVLTKTVGLDPNLCATTDEITVAPNTDVTYCYEVENTGNVEFNFHDLTDSELGALLTDYFYNLAPGASVFVTETANIAVTTVNTATWYAEAIPPKEGFPSAQATDVATVTVAAQNPAIVLNKTVGTVPGVCAVTQKVTVPAGTEVYYCYQVENTGDVEFNFHDLEDSELGTLLDNLPYTLSPGAFSPQVIVPETINITTTNWATWTAFTSLGGYVYDDGAPYDYASIATFGTPLGLADDGEANATIPFPFTFYGVTSSNVRIGNNGGILFNATTGDMPITNAALPIAAPALSILPFWDDIDSDTGDVYYATTGSAPNRQFIVEWFNRPHFSNTGSATFQVVLYETTNQIKFLYADVDFGNASYNNGASATVGINKDATTALQYSFNQPVITDQSAILWTPVEAVSATSSDYAEVNVQYPQIDVDPLSFDVKVGLGQTTTRTLDIANVGDAPLNWLIEEEDTTSATTPTVPNANPAAALDTVQAGDGTKLADSAPAPLSAWRVPEAVLWDNGPLVTNPGAGAGGADASALQTALGLSIYGFGHAVSSGFRVADDFTVPVGGWLVSDITFFAYQTGSTTTSTINNVNLRIWDGVPGQGGSNVVFGDTATNRLASSAWSNIYRVLDTGLSDSTRPVMADVATVNTFLPAGTYWVDWQTGGTLGSGPWAPPVSILGQTAKPGSNGLQYDPAAGTWSPLVDTGTAQAPQDLPFIIQGTPAAGADCLVPSDIAWLTVTPDNGTTAAGGSTPVQLDFDSTSLAAGIYTGNLCITSNDPDAGPGNGTDLVIVPITLEVNPPTAVALTNLATDAAQSPVPLAGLPLAALPAAVAAALGAAFVWRRQRD